MSSISFSTWPSEIHDTPDQQTRIASATSSKTTPSSVNRISQSATFAGSGALPYLTTLSSCSCGDFLRRHLPCKHIYRLAIELGAMEGIAQSGINKNILRSIQISLEDAVAELENQTDEAQLEIKRFLYEGLYHKADHFPTIITEQTSCLLSCSLIEQVDDPTTAIQAFKRNRIIELLDAHNITGFKRNSSLKNLAQWCSENIQNFADIFPSVATFRFSDIFQSGQRKIYTYLLRKYDDQTVLVPDSTGRLIELNIPYGSTNILTLSASGNRELTGKFPDDKVTQLLTQYGHNRCLK